MHNEIVCMHNSEHCGFIVLILHHFVILVGWAKSESIRFFEQVIPGNRVANVITLFNNFLFSMIFVMHNKHVGITKLIFSVSSLILFHRGYLPDGELKEFAFEKHFKTIRKLFESF